MLSFRGDVNVTSNNFELGTQLSEALFKALDGKGNIVKFYHSAHPGVHQRELGLDATLEKYPDIKVIADHFVKVPGPVDDGRIATTTSLRGAPLAFEAAADSLGETAATTARAETELHYVHHVLRCCSHLTDCISGTPLPISQQRINGVDAEALAEAEPVVEKSVADAVPVIEQTLKEDVAPALERKFQKIAPVVQQAAKDAIKNHEAGKGKWTSMKDLVKAYAVQR